MFFVALGAYAVAATFSFVSVESRLDRHTTIAKWATYVGLAAQIVFMVAIAIAIRRAPWGSLYEFTAVFGATMMGIVAFVLLPRRGAGFVAGSVALVVVALMIVVRIFAFSVPTTLLPALQSWWLVTHVLTAIIGSALLFAGTVSSILYLVRRNWENKHPTWRLSVVDEADSSETPVLAGRTAGPGAALATSLDKPGFGGRLPTADRLDTISRKLISIAFPIWTVSILLGAVWGEQAWGRYWGWDPKETVAFLTWAIYAAYLHARATATWRGKRAAILSIVGGGFILFNMFGINFLISGLHSYSGG